MVLSVLSDYVRPPVTAFAPGKSDGLCAAENQRLIENSNAP